MGLLTTTNSSNRFQISGYYLLSIVVLSIFTFRSVTTGDYSDAGYTVILLISAPFLIAAFARKKLEPLIVSSQNPLDQPKKQLLLDIWIFTFIATEIFFFQLFAHQYPFLVALQIFVWAMIIGYFASIDSSLNRVREIYQTKDIEDAPGVNSVSITQRLNIFLSTTLLIVSVAVALSAYTYMGVDTKTSSATINNVRQEFIVDVLFILGIVVSLTTRIIFSYSLNIQRLFSNQLDILQKLREGDLEHYVPVVTKDEFGMIAQQTNKVIDELREKEKIQNTLERIVSPNIMDKLLNGNAKELKQGEQYDIAILFCDLRKFTNYAENTPPEEVIFFLNAYFTKIADVVAEHNGIINKFMGDAILAVFGVEGDPDYVERAVETAWDIIMHSDSAIMRDGTKFDIGIGIHKGKAAAGTIGSADRFEYTFIGDAVNTASRLDGLSKRTHHKIIISSAVYDSLNKDTQLRFNDLGRQMVRGKSSPMQIYGAVPSTPSEGKKIVRLKTKKSNRF